MRRTENILTFFAVMIISMAIAVAITAFSFAYGVSCVYAESFDFSGSSEFTGDEIKSTFKTGEVADAVTNLQPGDEMSFEVEYKNSYAGKTDWYMTNEIVQTLEKANSARKVIKGTGTAENGAYTYELINVDKNGKEQIIFSNNRVGGDEQPGGLQGLEQATNATSEWFYIATLNEGETGKIKLHIAFEGETEVNDYMDTDGTLEIAFAVDIPKEEETEEPEDEEPEETQKKPSRKAVKSGVKTGDNNYLPLYIALLIAGSGLLVIVLKQKGGDTDEEK